MDLIQYLKKILDLINASAKKADESTDQKKIYLQLANALRLYYSGLNQIFVAKKVLSNINYSTFSISDDEKVHIENAGWVLDNSYNEETYIPSLKSNLILDIWSVLPADIKIKNDFFINLNKLVGAILNNSYTEEEITFKELSVINKSGEINFMTPENTLTIINKIIEEL